MDRAAWTGGSKSSICENSLSSLVNTKVHKNSTHPILLCQSIRTWPVQEPFPVGYLSLTLGIPHTTLETGWDTGDSNKLRPLWHATSPIRCTSSSLLPIHRVHLPLLELHISSSVLTLELLRRLPSTPQSVTGCKTSSWVVCTLMRQSQRPHCPGNSC